MSELSFLSIRNAGAGLLAREFSVVELVDSVLERIDTTNAVLQAFVEVLATEAREEARSRDKELQDGWHRGPLHGIPIGVKDIYDVEGVPTRCGSRVREQVETASHDAAVVRRLREAGAIVVGKTTTQEFAAGVVSPPARNPWNTDRIPGGSSGGSAAALAVGAAIVGLGSDTGGSIRIPASVCGVVGLKPTFGLLSTDGVYPLAWSLDTVGPLARSVEDAAYAFDAMAGRRGPESIASALKQGSKRVRVGVSRPHFFDRLQPGVAAAVESAIGSLARVDGIDLIEAQWDDAGLARAAGFIINRVESSSVHQDGIARHPELYGEELRLRLEANALFPATSYLKALRARTRLRESIARFFTDHDLDVMIAPTTPATAADASTLRVQYADESAEHVSLAYTRLTMPFNLTGQPALSLPCGFDAEGLPVGLQVVGRPYQEQALCQVGATIESAWAGAVGAAWPRILRIACQVHD
jgi:aspartyl-tRNA(Asn)/glutamyl-tRNA(Gln) amidotransferase subunit A